MCSQNIDGRLGRARWNHGSRRHRRVHGRSVADAGRIRMPELRSRLKKAAAIVRSNIIVENVRRTSALLIFGSSVCGIQLIGIGIIGEYIGRIYVESKQRPIYLIRQKFRSSTPDKRDV